MFPLPLAVSSLFSHTLDSFLSHGDLFPKHLLTFELVFFDILRDVFLTFNKQFDET